MFFKNITKKQKKAYIAAFGILTFMLMASTLLTQVFASDLGTQVMNSATYEVGEAADELTVDYKVSASSEAEPRSAVWQMSTDGTTYTDLEAGPIPGGGFATSSNWTAYLTPPTEVAGTFYYRCKVLIGSAPDPSTGPIAQMRDGCRQTIVYSSVAKITVVDSEPEPEPVPEPETVTITGLPESVELRVGESYTLEPETDPENAEGRFTFAEEAGGGSLEVLSTGDFNARSAGETAVEVSFENDGEVLAEATVPVTVTARTHISTSTSTSTSTSGPIDNPIPGPSIVPIQITAQPEDAGYMQGATATPLYFGVSSALAVQYQWFLVSHTGSELALAGANSADYVPNTNLLDEAFYYCVAKNSSGASVSSRLAKITVTAPPPTVVSIIDEPQDAVFVKGQTPASPLRVTAELENAAPGATLSYQWYKNTQDANTGGTPVDGATEESYTPPTTLAGNTYYYCVVGDSASDAEATSRAAKVTVFEPTLTATPDTIDYAGDTVDFVYALGIPVGDVSVTFEIPNVVVSSDVTGLTPSGGNYTGTTGSNGTISFSVLYGSGIGSFTTVTATETTYNTSASETVNISTP